MNWISSHATTGNILLLIGAVAALANFIRAVAPAGSAAAKVCDKLLALTVDLHKLLGTTAAIVLALVLCLFVSRSAHAAPSFHAGPSVSLYELRLDGQIGQLTPGIGVQGWVDWRNGFALGAAVFGSGLGLGTAHPGAAFSVAPYACYEPVGLCVGPGIDLASIHGGVSGLVQGFTWQRNFFLVAQVLPHFWELLHLSAG